MEKLEVTFKITLDDVKEFQNYHIKKRSGYKFFIIFSIIFIPLCLLGFFVDSEKNKLLGFMVILYFIIIFIGIPMLIRHRSKQNFTTQKSYAEEIQYIMDENGYFVKGSTFESKQLWSSLYNVQELKNIFVLYGNKYAASIIPKRALTEDSKSYLRNLFKLNSLLKTK